MKTWLKAYCTGLLCLLLLLVSANTFSQSKDINADGRSDLIWTNKTTGNFILWYGADPTRTKSDFSSSGYLGGIGNIAHDATPDFIFIHRSLPLIGVSLLSWSTDTYEYLSTSPKGYCSDMKLYIAPTKNECKSPWTLVGLADFDGVTVASTNTKQDEIFMWDPATGKNDVWFFSTTTGDLGYVAVPINKTPLKWQPDSVTDFDSNGLADVIWRHKSKNTVSMLTFKKNKKGKVRINFRPLPKPPKGYEFLAAVPLDNDNVADLVWKDDAHHVVVWGMKSNGSQKKNGKISLEPVEAQDQIATVGDFDNDTYMDLVWRNKSTGKVVIWYTKPNDIGAISINKVDVTADAPTGDGWEILK